MRADKRRRLLYKAMGLIKDACAELDHLPRLDRWDGQPDDAMQDLENTRDTLSKLA